MGVQGEQAFWDAHAGTLDNATNRYLTWCQRGLEPNLQLAVEWLGPLEGARVLDFACGTGTLGCYLASLGAVVTGVDISSASIEIANQVARSQQLTATFSATDLFSMDLRAGTFDAIIGSYALHHVDVSRYAPELARVLRLGGRAAFLETLGLNPLLMLARKHLVGCLGIPRWGTPDERPLQKADLETIRRAFGLLGCDQTEYRFLSMIDVQWLQGRAPRAGRLLRSIDQVAARAFPRASYHQVLLCRKPAATE
jgi:SAM-dependent methyltransferase